MATGQPLAHPAGPRRGCRSGQPPAAQHGAHRDAVGAQHQQGPRGGGDGGDHGGGYEHHEVAPVRIKKDVTDFSQENQHVCITGNNKFCGRI